MCHYTVCRSWQMPLKDDKWRMAQGADPDLVPIVWWLKAGGECPRWEEVAAESPATKSRLPS